MYSLRAYIFLVCEIIVYADIPYYFTKSNPKEGQPPPPANFVGTSEFGTCECTDHLAKKLETDPMLLDIDPYLTPIQLQLEIGLRKLRKIQPPTIWIMGHAHETTIQAREAFARSLADVLDYTYINMDTEIWKRTEATSEELANINNDFAKKGDHVGKSAHSRLVVMSWKLTSNPSVTLSEEGVLEMLKLILVHYHNSNGFVIDSFPCNEIGASGFEAMFYPVTFSIYIRPPAMKRYKPRSKNAARHNDGHKKNETRASYESVLEPSNFRRSHSYHEIEVQNIAHKYKDQLRALILDHGIDLGEHEVELAGALILEELSRKTKEKKDFLQIHHPPANYHDMIGLANCYNPYCDCHILEDETKNPLLARDEQAMNQIIRRMRADQEEFRPSLLRLLDQRDQKEGGYYQQEDNDSVTINVREGDADEIFGGAWTEASSTTQEDFTPKFRFHEVSSGQIGHGHHSDHHALRDICSRGRLFEWDESSVQFLLKPNKAAAAAQPPSDVNDKGGIVSKIGWAKNDITTDDETSEAGSEHKLIEHNKITKKNPGAIKLVGDDDDEFLEDVSDDDDQDEDNSGEEELLENSEDEENDDNNDVPAGVNQNVQANHDDVVDEEARQRTIGGGDGGRPPPQQ